MDKIKTYNDFFEQVREGLIKTYPIKTTIKLISRDLILRDIKHGIDYEKSTNTLFIKVKSIDINKEDILNIFRQVNLCGYFISNYNFYDKNNNQIDYLIHKNIINNYFIETLFNKIKKSSYTQITVESKYNSKLELPDKLYHVTSISNKSKIEKDGLVPKSKRKKANHNDRIYVGYNPTVIKNLAKQFKKDKYILIEINTKKLQIELYDDPDLHNHGGYTYDNIHKDHIKIIEEFEVN